MLGCSVPVEKNADTAETEAETLLPVERYTCLLATDAITVDGELREESWQQAERVPIRCMRTSSHLADPVPGFARMCWDKKNFYIAFEVPDTDIRGEGKIRDIGNIVCPNDVVEVFLDINGDDHHFFELHINPWNTFNDLFIIRPPEYSPLHSRTRFGLVFMKKFNLSDYNSAVKIYGTINDPEDTDKKWVVEMALPYKALMMPYTDGPRPKPKAHPSPGEIWRVQLVVQNCTLEKRYHVWSPAYSAWHHHGVKRWGRVVFSGGAETEATE